MQGVTVTITLEHQVKPRTLLGKPDDRVLALIIIPDCKLSEKRVYVFSHALFSLDTDKYPR